jgi:hypothetical protein
MRDPQWVIFCKRTEDPKLAYIEWMLEGEGIDTRRNGHSFHAPILEVRDTQQDRAWELLKRPFDGERNNQTLDDMEDDDPVFEDAIQLRDEARDDSAPPR